MITRFEVNETNEMIKHENLDVRTITLGISLLDCISGDLATLCENIRKKILSEAENLVPTGKEIESMYGIPIVNKRISVTPIALIGGAACRCPEDFVEIAKTLDECAKSVGVNFIGGYSALVSKAMTTADDDRRRKSDPLDPESARPDRPGVQLRKCRIHKDRNQHGCSPPDGPDDQGSCLRDA